MKVCFYFDNKRRADIDYSKPEEGNPGIGGTEYMIWTVSYYLSKNYKEIDVYLLAPFIENLPQETINIKCEDVYSAIKISSDIKADVLVVRNRAYDKDIYDMIDRLKVKTVIWSHNFEKYDSLKYATDCEYIKRNVCVSREQYDRLRDHSIYKKSTYIYNGIDCKNYKEYEKSCTKKENIVCYVGAIKPTKAFHILAKNWNEIEKRVPGVKLHVIGGGNLYDKNVKLGKYNIAEENYENQFINYITDSEGILNKNIKFMGVLGGSRKIYEMSKAKVGIVNPIAKDETFCISAIEFGALGVPVVARKRYGLLNTIDNNKSGMLFRSEKEMVNQIVNLLNNNEECDTKGKYAVEYVNSKFDINNISYNWKVMLQEIINNKDAVEMNETINYECDYKWIREINRKIKTIRLFKGLPALLEYPECIYNNKFYLKCSTLKSKIRFKLIRGTR